VDVRDAADTSGQKYYLESSEGREGEEIGVGIGASFGLVRPFPEAAL
jgi:hypothetical protein